MRDIDDFESLMMLDHFNEWLHTGLADGLVPRQIELDKSGIEIGESRGDSTYTTIAYFIEREI